MTAEQVIGLSSSALKHDTMDIIECAYELLFNAPPGVPTSDCDAWTRAADEVCARGNVGEAILSLQSVLERYHNKCPDSDGDGGFIGGGGEIRAQIYRQLMVCLKRASPDRRERKFVLLKDVACSVANSFEAATCHHPEVRFDGRCFYEIMRFAKSVRTNFKVTPDQVKVDANAAKVGSTTIKGDTDAEEQVRRTILNLLADVSNTVLVSYLAMGSIGPIAPLNPIKKSHRPLNTSTIRSAGEIAAIHKIKDVAMSYFQRDEGLKDIVRYAMIPDTKHCSNDICTVLMCVVISEGEKGRARGEDPNPATGIEWPSLLEKCIPLINKMYQNNDSLMTKPQAVTLSYMFVMCMLNKCTSESIHSLGYYYLSLNDLVTMIFDGIANGTDQNIHYTAVEIYLTLYDRLSLECRLELLKSSFCHPAKTPPEFKAVCIDLVRDEIHANLLAAPQLHLVSSEDELDVASINVSRRRKFLKNIVDEYVLEVTREATPPNSRSPVSLCSPVMSTLSLIRYCAVLATSEGVDKDDLGPRCLAVKEFMNFKVVRSDYLKTVGDRCHDDRKCLTDARVLLERLECDEDPTLVRDEAMMLSLKAQVDNGACVDLICDVYNVTSRRVNEAIEADK